jgi:hypothetical protein
MTSRASSCCVGSCRPTPSSGAPLRPHLPPFLLHRRGRSSTSSPVLEVEEPSSSSRCSAGVGSVRRRPGGGPAPNSRCCRARVPPSWRPHSTPAPCLRPERWGASVGRETPEQRKSRRGGASTLLRAGFGRCGSSSTVPTSALRRVDPRIGGSRILRGRGDLPLLGSPAGAGMRGAGREERGRE